MKFTLSQAAKQTGKGKGTLSRDIRNGKISAEKQPDGSYEIDASELFRVYPRVEQPASETGDETPGWNDPQPYGSPFDDGRLRAELELLRQRIKMADQMHDKELSLLNDRIEELREDREDLRSERDSLLKTLQEQALSVRMLTDQSLNTPPPPASPPASPPATPDQSGRRGFFSLFRRSA